MEKIDSDDERQTNLGWIFQTFSTCRNPVAALLSILLFVNQIKVTKEGETATAVFDELIRGWQIYWEYGKSWYKNVAAIFSLYSNYNGHVSLKTRSSCFCHVYTASFDHIKQDDGKSGKICFRLTSRERNILVWCAKTTSVSVCENDESVAGWKAGGSVPYCDTCCWEKMKKFILKKPATVTNWTRICHFHLGISNNRRQTLLHLESPSSACSNLLDRTCKTNKLFIPQFVFPIVLLPFWSALTAVCNSASLFLQFD